jgi:twinkle protein
LYHLQLQELGIPVKTSARGDTKTICPKCSHTRAKKFETCLSANVDTGVYNCKHCDFKGTVGKGDPASYGNREYRKPGLEILRQDIQYPEAITKYFQSRLITKDTLLKYRVTSSIRKFGDVEKGAIDFNYFDEKGELINIKHRSREKDFLSFAGGQPIPYGLDVAWENIGDEIMFVEGEIDVLSWFESGYSHAISVPNGAPPPPQEGRQYAPRLLWLDEFIGKLDKIKKIYLALDSDLPGRLLTEELARRLGKERCVLVKFPPGYKDANEVMMGVADRPALWEDGLRKAYREAEPYPIEGVEDAEDVWEEIEYYYQNGLPEGDEIGLSTDELVKWLPKMVTVVTGIPGHGKTSFVKKVMVELSKRYGWKWLVYSAEEASTAMALINLMSIYTDTPFYESGRGERMSKDQLGSIKSFLKAHFKYVKLDEETMSVEKVLTKARQMVRSMGINGLVIDNATTIERDLPKAGESRHNATGDMITHIRKAAKLLGIHVIIVAHPKKMPRDKNGDVITPEGYDISDSAHWFNLPDIGITIRRDFKTKQTDVIAWKVRYPYVGEIGERSLSFNPRTGNYYDGVNSGSDQQKFVGQPYGEQGRFQDI